MLKSGFFTSDPVHLAADIPDQPAFLLLGITDTARRFHRPLSGCAGKCALRRNRIGIFFILPVIIKHRMGKHAMTVFMNKAIGLGNQIRFFHAGKFMLEASNRANLQLFHCFGIRPVECGFLNVIKADPAQSFKKFLIAGLFRFKCTQGFIKTDIEKNIRNVMGELIINGIIPAP